MLLLEKGEKSRMLNVIAVRLLGSTELQPRAPYALSTTRQAGRVALTPRFC